MTIRCALLGLLLTWLSPALQAAEFFSVEIRRLETVRLEREPPGKNLLVKGRILLNGKDIGATFENGDKVIPPGGPYKGLMRYSSSRNFVQGPNGVMSKEGDFLLEVSVGGSRTDILLHAGNLPRHSTGCIALGPATLDPANGSAAITKDSPLYKLRETFYGTQTPNQSPNKEIVVTVTEGSEFKGSWPAPPPAPAAPAPNSAGSPGRDLKEPGTPGSDMRQQAAERNAAGRERAERAAAERAAAAAADKGRADRATAEKARADKAEKAKADKAEKAKADTKQGPVSTGGLK